MSEEDKELERLKQKKLKEMKEKVMRKQQQQQQVEQGSASSGGVGTKVSSRNIVVNQLGYRGMEVLEKAESQFPQETSMIVAKLAELIRNGEIQEKIDGGQLLSLFRSVGMRIRIDTTIKVQEKDKFVSLSDKLHKETKKYEDSETSGNTKANGTN